MRILDLPYIKSKLAVAALFAISITSAATATTISNPQSDFAGSRATALGKSPALIGETSALFLNPSVISEVESPVADFTYVQPLLSFSTVSIVTAMPFYGFGAGLSFAQQSADNFYTTSLDSDRVRPTTQFSAGFRTLAGTLAKSFDHFWILPKFSIGGSAKWSSQFIGSDQRGLISADVGATSTLIRPTSWIDDLTIGGSIINGFSTSAKWPNGLSGNFTPEIRLGVAASTLDNALHLFLHNDQKKPIIGAEYDLHSSVQLRAATDFNQFEIGIGILLDRLSGVGQSPVKLKFDYSYVQLGGGLNLQPWNAFTLRYLGLSQSTIPTIQLPISGTHTEDDHIEVVGAGPKNATITIISNGTPIKRVDSDNTGYWKAEIPLSPGQNNVQAQAKSDDSVSNASVPVSVYSAKGIETSTPEFIVEGDRLILQTLRGNSQIPTAMVDDKAISFTASDGYWTADITNLLSSPIHRFVSTNFATVSVTQKTESGTPLSTTTVPIFLRAVKGVDQSQTYNRIASLVGEVSPIVASIRIDGASVGISQGYYSAPAILNLGRNRVPFDITLQNGQKFTLYARITRLREFTDLLPSDADKKTIEGLATLGALNFIKQSEFSGNSNVTLSNLVDFLSHQLGIDTALAKHAYTFDELTNQASPNETNYRLLVGRGILQNNGNQSYAPNRPVTMDELITSLSKIGIQTTPGNAGPVKRRDFTKILANSPEFQTKLTALFSL